MADFTTVRVGQVKQAAATGKLDPESSIDQVIQSNADAHAKRGTLDGVKLNMSSAAVERIHSLIGTSAEPVSEETKVPEEDLKPESEPVIESGATTEELGEASEDVDSESSEAA